MDAKVKELKSGKVKYILYKPEEIKTTRTKGLIRDIYENVEGFDKTVVWITKVIPTGKHTQQDVLKEYFKKADEKDEITVVQAGIIKEIPEAGDIEEGLKMIEEEKDMLRNTNFDGIIWNRKMAHVFGNPDYFVYKNANGNTFISEHTGDIIDRIQPARSEQ